MAAATKSILRDLTTGNVSAKTPLPLVVIQYDLASSPWPLVRRILQRRQRGTKAIVLSFRNALRQRDIGVDVQVLDWSAQVPGYGDGEWKDPLPELKNAIAAASGTATLVAIDSVDTLLSDSGGSVSKTITHLRSLLSPSTNTTLILPIPRQSALLPHLTSTTSFSPSLLHLTLHPPNFVARICREFLLSGPTDPRFWSVFGPAAERGEGEREWRESRAGGECVVEVLVRKKPGSVERSLEGWRDGDGGGVVLLSELGALKDLGVMPVGTQSSEGVDVTKGLSFNLSLTDAQAEAKSKVVLPYTFHQNDPPPIVEGGAIHYEPDSADDMDDEDPDEDLDL